MSQVLFVYICVTSFAFSLLKRANKCAICVCLCFAKQLNSKVICDHNFVMTEDRKIVIRYFENWHHCNFLITLL